MTFQTIHIKNINWNAYFSTRLMEIVLENFREMKENAQLLFIILYMYTVPSRSFSECLIIVHNTITPYLQDL